MKLFMVKSPESGKQRGFMIIELIIAVAVIAIMTAVSVVTYRAIQTEGNDKARAADVAAIMDALEKYYDKNGEYPADDTLNPTNSPTRLPDFNAVKTALPSLSNEALTGPGDYQFYANCPDTACTNTGTNWKTYMTRSYWYQSRRTSGGPSFSKSVAASYGTNTGWGCTVTTNSNNPSYVIAWYSEAKKIWIFERSLHGHHETQLDANDEVTIASYGGGPVAPQTCTFS